MTRTVCVVGAGAREHALAHALARSADVVVTPGRAAMASDRVTVTSASPLDVEADLVVVGPEQPLVDGLADALRARGRLVVGPGADGARLEGSKSYMKEFLVAAGVPTARHGSFEDLADANAFLAELSGTVVVKTDGLAAGKGVLVTDDHELARRDVAAKLSGLAFGDAGRRVVIEEGLDGEECSLLVLVDGSVAVPLAPSRDYKRLYDGDLGPNTGGIGAVSPAPRVDELLVKRIMAEAIEPTIAELERRGIEYRGVLYAGVMATREGPKLLEYNVRLGDPESEVVLPRLADDPFDLFEACASGRLTTAPRFTEDAAVAVVLAAAGYPGAPVAGAVIEGLAPDGQLATPIQGVTVYHAGTQRRDGQFLVDGGRVLTLVGLGPSIDVARARVYAAVGQVHFEGCHARSDVAADAGVPA
jgi:phosphoribosylamine--glycine ligase